MAKYKMVGNNRIELKGEELSEFEKMQTDAHNNFLLQKQKETEKANLKASAKAKLIAGEPLTQEEADTIVL